jgi:hypothetical protein
MHLEHSMRDPLAAENGAQDAIQDSSFCSTPESKVRVRCGAALMYLSRLFLSVCGNEVSP